MTTTTSFHTKSGSIHWFLAVLASIVSLALLVVVIRPLETKTELTNNDNLILVMGLPRSGSLSIHNFFRCNHIPSRHYCCDGSDSTRFPCPKQTTCGKCVHHNMNTSQAALANCGDSNTRVFAQFDVETGDPFSWFLPQHFTMPLLHQDYPDAIFILNRRNSQKWATNVLHWYSVSNRLLNAFGKSYYSEFNATNMGPIRKITENNLYQELKKSLDRASSQYEYDRRFQLLVEIYESHLERVRDFSRQHPSHHLIEINVDDSSNAGTILAKSFGLDETCWKFDAEALDNDWQDFSFQL